MSIESTQTNHRFVWRAMPAALDARIVLSYDPTTMALRLIRICSVAAILVVGLMAHGPAAAAAHVAHAPADGAGHLPQAGLTGEAAPPDAPDPSEVPAPEVSPEPVPSEVPEPEPELSPEPAPSDDPAPTSSPVPVSTESPQPEASVEPAPSEAPSPAESVEPVPSEPPQPEASVGPAPSAAPSTGAIVEPEPEAAALESDEPSPAVAAADASPDPEPRVRTEESVEGQAVVTTDSAMAVLATPAGASPSPSSLGSAQAPANPEEPAPSPDADVGPALLPTRWISRDGPGVIGAIPGAILEGAEPVSAGVAVGIAATNRTPSVAVAMEFGRAGSGWAGAIVFNLWLRRQMRERRMSQRRLAVLSGVNHSTISRLLNHDRQPSLETATKLAKALRTAGGELDTADYFERLPEETLFPARRVEMALRGDDLLDDADVERLMRSYLRARASRHGIPRRLVADGASSQDAEAPR